MHTKGNMTFFFSKREQFSNLFISAFEVKGVRFNCVEKFMMYCKAKLFGDESTANAIMAATHPRAGEFMKNAPLICAFAISLSGCDVAKDANVQSLRRFQ